MTQPPLFSIHDQRDNYHIYTKESLIERLIEISKLGWIPNLRPGNDGGVGNTLEDLLEIKENNLPIPNAAEWELKSHRINSTALNTLFHCEPSPRALKFVPNYFITKIWLDSSKSWYVYPPN